LIARWSAGTAGAADLTIASLVPLRDDQARRLARAYGVTDDEAFWNAVEENGLVQMTARPQDIEWLSGYWRRQGRFANLAAMIEDSLQFRLIDQRAGAHGVDLPAAHARSAAERLAAFATACGERSFPVRGDVGGSVPQVEALLPGWRPHDVRGLLQLAVFDESTAGRIRIHTKELQEYLAARWLMRQQDQGVLTDRRLIELLFRPASGASKVVPAHLVPVAAWIAADRPVIRDLMIEHCPQHLLDEADATRLPVPVRERAIRSFVEKFGDRDRLGFHLNLQSLHRLAHNDLAPALGELIGSTRGEDPLAALLDIVGEGRISVLADVATEIATTTTRAPRVRYAAARAAARSGTQVHRARLLDLLGEQDLDPDLAGALLDSLFPDPLDAAQFERMLGVVGPRVEARRTTRFDVVLGYELPRTCPRGLRPAILRVYSTLFGDGDVNEWLRGPIARFLAVHLSDQPVATPDVRALVLALSGDEDVHSVDLNSLRELARTNREVRRLLLSIVARVEEPGAAAVPVRRLLMNPLVNTTFDASDFEWLAGRAIEAGNLTLRDAAMAAGRAVAAPVDPPPPVVPQGPFGRRTPHATGALSAEDVAFVSAHVDELRAGRNLGLLQGCTAPFMSHEDWGTIDSERIEAELGPANLEALRQGLRGVRQADVIAPRAATDDQTPAAVVLGLVGLHLEFTRGLDVTALSEPEVIAATRLAEWELNHFPPWFETLARSHPAVVASELAEQAVAELLGRSRREYVLSKVLRAPEPTRDAVARAVEAAMRTNDPIDEERIEIATRLIISANVVDRAAWRVLLPERLRSSVGDRDRYLHWLLLQLQLDPQQALTVIETLARSEVEADRMRAREVVDAIWCVVDDRLVPVAFLDDNQILQRFYTLLCAPTFASRSTFDPGTRLRSAAIQWLRTRVGSGPFFEGLSVRTDGEFPRLREWHLRLSHEAWLGDPTCAPMATRDAQAWLDSLDVDASTDHGLFALVLAKLSDIDSFLTEDMRSYRGVFMREVGPAGATTFGPVVERFFQLWVAAELQARSSRAYSVVREEENAAGNAPDVTVHAPRLLPVSIEIKVAESWTVPDLQAALSTQLVGQYMSNGRSTHGILVVCACVRGRQWEPEGTALAIEDVVRDLRARAATILEARTDLRRLEVVLLDFRDGDIPTPRPRRRRAAQLP